MLLLLAEVSSLGVPAVPWHTQILADQLTLSQSGGVDYAHQITSGTPGFSDLPTALQLCQEHSLENWKLSEPFLSAAILDEHKLVRGNVCLQKVGLSDQPDQCCITIFFFNYSTV